MRLRSANSHASKLPPACPEFLLVAAALRRPTEPDTIDRELARTEDWPNFLAVVDKHRVAGLVLEGLAGRTSRLPPATLAGLSARARATALHAVATTREAFSVTQALEQAGIPAAVLKGPTLSALAYGDVKLRQCRDVDLLVPAERTIEAHTVLSGLGYQLHQGDDPTPEQLGRYLRRHKHLAYAHNRSGVTVELHGRLHDNASLCQRSHSPSTWQTVDVGFGLKLRTLSTQDLLLYLCVHGASHGWFRLKWLADVAALLQKYPEEMAPLLQRSQEWKLSRAVVQGLTLSAHLFGTAPVPVDPDWAERRLIQVGWDALTRSRASTELHLERFASTRIRLSQLLLSFHPQHLRDQLRFELTVDRNGPSSVSPSLQRTTGTRTVEWLANKARSRKL